MEKQLEELSIKELENLKKNYLAKISEINNQITIKGNEERAQLEQIRNPQILNEKQIIDRVNRYLQVTNYSDIPFLDYNMRVSKSFNNKGQLSNTGLIFLDKEMKKLVESYEIMNESQLLHIILNHQIHKNTHPIIQDENFMIAWKQVATLKHLDNIFQNEQNRIDYQGTYAAFQYVKKHIEECLSTDTEENENELVWKNFDKKKIIVTENLTSIATYVLTQKSKIPGARIFINNGGLSRMTKKKQESTPTYIQERFVEAIAFGTTLEKLNQQNYEDAKQLIYIPKK